VHVSSARCVCLSDVLPLSRAAAPATRAASTFSFIFLVYIQVSTYAGVGWSLGAAEVASIISEVL